MTAWTTEYQNSLTDLMHTVLNGVVHTFNENNIDLPARRYLATATTSHDCEQVTVSLTQLYLGPPGSQATGPEACDAPRTAVLHVQIVRCIPKVRSSRGEGTGPPVESLTAIAEQQSKDAWMLMAAAEDISDSMGWTGHMADVSPGEAQGGFQAVDMNLILGVP